MMILIDTSYSNSACFVVSAMAFTEWPEVVTIANKPVRVHVDFATWVPYKNTMFLQKACVHFLVDVCHPDWIRG